MADVWYMSCSCCGLAETSLWHHVDEEVPDGERGEIIDQSLGRSPTDNSKIVTMVPQISQLTFDF